jgi:hypothetical protein
MKQDSSISSNTQNITSEQSNSYTEKLKSFNGDTTKEVDFKDRHKRAKEFFESKDSVVDFEMKD